MLQSGICSVEILKFQYLIVSFIIQNSSSGCNLVCVPGSEWAVLYTVLCVSVLWILCFEFLHSIMSTEWPLSLLYLHNFVFHL